jgi:hypothetical protein
MATRGNRFAIVLASMGLALAAPTVASAGEWLAGDLHVHTTYSHDSYGGPGDDNTGPQDANTLGFPVLGDFALAASRGLDYLAITDHMDVRSQSDPGFGAFGVLGLPGYENSLDGHAQMLGATHVFPTPDVSSPVAVQAHADALRAEGGVFQINHPVNSETDDPDDLDWALGYAVQPDTVEAWNSSRLYQPPFPASNSHDDAIRYWEGWLDRGARVALTGGSDSHWIATSAAQGPGQPTTWVYAADRSVSSVLAGLRAGHTMVSHQPPNLLGPRIFLEADGDGDGTFESMVGDTVPRGSRLRVRVEGAPGTVVHLVTDGGRDAASAPVVRGHFHREFTLPASSTWVRAQVLHPDGLQLRRSGCPRALLMSYCRNRLLVYAMTSALYLGGASG